MSSYISAQITMISGSYVIVIGAKLVINIIGTIRTNLSRRTYQIENKNG
ncbi:MAG: hypothetical protein ACW991_01610 [Candidatus Hodarchaeales archaeon]